jgi:hypothetical protein
MIEGKRIEIKLHYDGGTADDGVLNLYDAGTSISGFARALAITTHALLNDGAVRKRAEGAEGAEFYISPSRQGSFLEVITVVITSDAAKAVGLGILGNVFWDFIKLVWSKTVGKEAEPETPKIRRLIDQNPELLDEIGAVLESALQQAHRPIQQDRQIEISIQRPRVGTILTLDTETLAYVTTRAKSDLVVGLIGNVTRYNILSGFGRFYDDVQECTIPFDLEDSLSAKEKRLLTWSMDQRVQGHEGKIAIDVTEITNAKGYIKRYRLHAVRLPPAAT